MTIREAIDQLAEAIKSEAETVPLTPAGKQRLSEARHEFEVAEGETPRIRALLEQIEILQHPILNGEQG